MKKYVIGDIHGRHDALLDVLAKCNFDKESDLLIVLGDVVDGGAKPKEVVEELLTIKNIVYIIGNHDYWAIDYFKTGNKPYVWVSQGGYNTIESYKDGVPESHKEFFDNGVYYHVEDNMLFVHGGMNPRIPIEENHIDAMLWDRGLIDRFKNGLKLENVCTKSGPYEAIFVGHTTTEVYGSDPKIKDCLAPLNFGGLWMLDTGAGWSGKLTIMDIHTKEYWQSKKLEPANIKGFK